MVMLHTVHRFIYQIKRAMAESIVLPTRPYSGSVWELNLTSLPISLLILPSFLLIFVMLFAFFLNISLLWLDHLCILLPRNPIFIFYFKNNRDCACSKCEVWWFATCNTGTKFSTHLSSIGISILTHLRVKTGGSCPTQQLQYDTLSAPQVWWHNAA